MIVVTVTSNLGPYTETAEAPDEEAAIVAARTLWDDLQAAVAPYYTGCRIVFSMAGRTLLATETRP